MAEILKPNRLNQIWAEDGTAVPPSDSKYRQGWIVEAPPYQTENYINQKHDTFIAHTNQHGLPQWDSETEYQAGKSWTLGTNGSLYFCKVTHTGQNPVTDLSETYWRKVLDGTNVLPAASVSPFALTLLDDTSASAMRQTLGGTTIGQNLFTANNALAARVAINAENASNLTSGTIPLARLPFTPVQQGGGISQGSNKIYIGWSNDASGLRATVDSTELGLFAFRSYVNDAANITTGTINTARLPVSTEVSSGIVTQATQTEVNNGSSTSKYVTPSKMRFGFEISLATNPGYIKAPSWMGGFIWGWGSFNAAGSSSGTITLTSIVPTAVRGVSVNLAVGAPGDQRPPRISPSGRNLLWQNTDGSAATFNYTFTAN